MMVKYILLTRIGFSGFLNSRKKSKQIDCSLLYNNLIESHETVLYLTFDFQHLQKCLVTKQRTLDGVKVKLIWSRRTKNKTCKQMQRFAPLKQHSKIVKKYLIEFFGKLDQKDYLKNFTALQVNSFLIVLSGRSALNLRTQT